MDAETLLYQQMDKYGNELTVISTEELKKDMLEIYRKLSPLPALKEVCSKLVHFISRKEYSKDEIVDTILSAIRIMEH